MKNKFKIFLVLILAMTLTIPSALAWGETKVGEQYTAACELLQQGKYAEAAAAFTALGGYADAPRYAMYCAAVNAGDQGLYASAVTNLSALTGFLDSDLLALYYTACSLEAAQEYEEAADILVKMSLYKDSAARLATYPARINARDYALADKNEQKGLLEKALRGFEALGSYEDSPARADAVREKIHARDYQAACDQEAEGKLEEALNAFVALGSYQDSQARADAVREKILARDYAAAAQYEEAGDYAMAYDLFVALGDYKDSAAHAAVVQQRAEYAKGMTAIRNGKYADAYAIFTALGDFEDAEQKSYILGINNFAKFSKVRNAVDGLVSFSFHGKTGVSNLYENVTMAPQWTGIEMMTQEQLRVSLKDSDGKTNYGVMDIHGNEIIKLDYSEISLLSNGMYRVARANTDYYNSIYEYGIRDAAGKIITDVEYLQISDFKNGLCVVGRYDDSRSVKKNTRNDLYECQFALMNEQGQILSDFYHEICGCNMYYNYRKNYGWRGSMIAPSFPDGLMWVKDAKNQYGFIDAAGKVAIDPQYSDAHQFSNGYAAVKNADGLWGYIDATGKTVIPFIYQEVTDFTAAGLADVNLNGSWQIIDRQGNLVYFK